MTHEYVLEVVKIITERDHLLHRHQEHVGYMNAKFKTKDDACSYYDKHNPHMRKLNTLGTYKSDWDQNTKLMYIVREDYMLNATIPPFLNNDVCINGKYKYLK